jgi:hypothetical protein
VVYIYVGGVLDTTLLNDGAGVKVELSSLRCRLQEFLVFVQLGSFAFQNQWTLVICSKF